MNADLSIINLIMGASPIVKAVMGLLLLASFVSWTMVFAKIAEIARAERESSDFEQQFWSGGDLATLHREISTKMGVSGGMESIFSSGFKEFARQRASAGIDPMAVVEGAQRAMRVALAREIDKLELHLSFLATVGSISPYIGLFGTVWGIMNSFRALGNVHNATLSMVAPGIAEALVATAMGLFAAIPAVIAYNRFSNGVDRLISRYQTFLDEFSTILQRQAHTKKQEPDKIPDKNRYAAPQGYPPGGYSPSLGEHP